MSDPVARSSHQPVPRQIIANVTIRFQVSEQFPNRHLYMGFHAGTHIRAVKMMLAVRAAASGHRNFVPTHSSLISLYLDGELLADNMMLTRDHHPMTLTLFP